MPPKVSIVVPTYNRADVLGRAIKSVLSQTLQDWELIIVDDGSTDDTRSVVGEYSDERIYYLYQENQGANAARMTGVRMARGEYISFLDSDDRFHEDYLSTVADSLRQENESCAGIATSYFRVKSNGDVRSVKRVPSGKITLEQIVDGNKIGSFSCVTLKSQLFTDIGSLDMNIKAAQDYEYYLRALKKGYYILGIDQIMVDQIESDNRISGNIERKKQAFGYLSQKHGDILSEERIADQHYMLGLIFSDRGEYRSGASHFRKAIQKNPKKVQYYYHYIFAVLENPFWDLSMRFKSKVGKRIKLADHPVV